MSRILIMQSHLLTTYFKATGVQPVKGGVQWPYLSRLERIQEDTDVGQESRSIPEGVPPAY